MPGDDLDASAGPPDPRRPAEPHGPAGPHVPPAPPETADPTARSEKPELRSRLLLRDEAPSDGPVVRPPGPNAPAEAPGGRYQILGEIARGGMGVIVKGNDKQLGRDVAMKLLREEYLDRPDVVQRFVEEAQIGGQLQHPGIVPVYELGLQGTKRPFFTMKLVKGRTLAALLEDRHDAATDRSRFLAMFQSICETVGYAHARGVLHRDLKPSNVMAGPFGEVQVMDWGLAKVVGQERPSERSGSFVPGSRHSVVATVRSETVGTQSLVGSVLGTPGYMSPEQARGEVDDLDERADVFSLGAILCEVLTGKPPYAGPDHEILERAARADLDEARARLTACGADPELVKLCELCLSPAREARPRNAKSVADQVARRLAAMESRARDAHRAAVEAEVVAEGAGRAKRLTRTIVGVAVAAVAVAAAATIVVVRSRAENLAEAERAAAVELHEAERIAEQARTSLDASLWKAALAHVGRAQDLVALASEQAQQRIDAAASVLETDARGATDAALARRREAEALRHVDEVRASLGRAADIPEDARRLADALRAAGIDPDAEAQVTVAALRASPHGAVLVPALDVLSSLRLRLGEGEGNAWRAVYLVDDDPLRAQIRSTRDVASLRALAAKLPDPPDPWAACLLADRMGSAGDANAAVETLRAVRVRKLDDFWLHWTCALWERRAEPADLLGAAASDTAALALRPEMTVLWPRLADSIARGGDATTGIAAATRAEEVAPDSPLPRTALGYALLTQGDREAAVLAFRASIAADARFVRAHLGLAEALVAQGDLDGALAEARSALDIAPADADAREMLARVHVARGEAGPARAAAREALRTAPRRVDARVVIARCDWLTGDYAEMRKVVEEARAIAKDDGAALSMQALVFVLDGKLTEAHQAARAGVARTPDDPWCRLALAIVLDRRADALDADWRYRRVLERDPLFAEAHLQYASFLRRQGRLREACDERRAALDASLGAPEALRVRVAALETLASRAESILPNLAAIAAPQRWSKDKGDRAALAEACAARGRQVSAARLRTEDAPPKDVLAADGARLDAAASAVLAALGWCLDGLEAEDPERTALLVRARELFSAELDAAEAALVKAPADERAAVRATLRAWRCDADLARAAAAAERRELPAGESEAWAGLGRRLEVVLATAQEERGDGR